MNRKFWLAAALMTAVLGTAGCGSRNPEDDFVFGKVRVSCANETITVEAPFELGVDGRLADLADRSAETVHAEGHNQYMQILVTGARRNGRTAGSEADAAAALMAENPAVSGLQSARDAVRIGSSEGERLIFSFTNTEKGRIADLTVTEYIFTQGDVMWRVIYQYRTGDETGKRLAEHVAGKLAAGATF